MIKIIFKEYIISFIFFLIISFYLTSCTINIPDIKITGEKTALENQILGEYKKIKEDAWMIASERGEKNNSILEIPADKKEIIEAIRNREFNRDDVIEFKISGIIGEKRDGYIEIVIDKDKIKNSLDGAKIKLLDKILKEENRDREIIMKRIYNLSFNNDENISKNDAMLEIQISFFKMNLDESPENTFYRDKNNEWEKK